MHLLQNFDEIESASDAELERLLWLSARKNYRGRLEKRILRIRQEIQRRKNSEKVKSPDAFIYRCNICDNDLWRSRDCRHWPGEVYIVEDGSDKGREVTCEPIIEYVTQESA